MRNNSHNKIKIFVGEFGKVVLVEYPNATKENAGIVECIEDDFNNCNSDMVFNLPIGLYCCDYLIVNDTDSEGNYNGYGEIININKIESNELILSL